MDADEVTMEYESGDVVESLTTVREVTTFLA